TDHRLARHRPARPRQGTRRRRTARLCTAGLRRPRPVERADLRAASLGRLARPQRQHPRDHDTPRPRERHRAPDRRCPSAGRGRDCRRRRHDHGRHAAGRARDGTRTRPPPPPRRRHLMATTAVLAYSGGLDTSCAIAWLKEDYGFDDVVAVLVDVGQATDFGPAFVRGREAGATDVLLLDRKTEFAEEVVARALKANA